MKDRSKSEKGKTILFYTYCGMTVDKGPTGKPAASQESPGENRVKTHRPRRRLGYVIEGRYLPIYLLDQPDLSPPA